MDDPNITMEEYIRLEEEKARRRGKVYNWETATYGRIWYDDDVHDLRYVETEFPTIVFNDKLTSEEALSCETTVSSLDDNKIDFRISFDEPDDEDHTVIFDKNAFSYKIIYVDELKTDSENDIDKVNMPSFPSPEPTEKLVSKNGYDVLDMALPPRDQRHQYLRFEGLEYTDADIMDFEERLGKIYGRGIHRVLVLDFESLPAEMAEGLTSRMHMEHRDAQGQSVFTSRAWRRLFEVRGPLVFELIMKFFSTFRFSEAIVDIDAVDTLQFQLGEAKRRINRREFILALGLHIVEEMRTASFGLYWAESARQISDKGVVNKSASRETTRTVFLYADIADKKSTKLVKYQSSGILLIMEYLVKISKKARILELKQRNMKKLILTSYTPLVSLVGPAGDPWDQRCMTRSSTKKLLTPFKDPEREFRSSRKIFKTLSLDESRSPEYNLFSDREDNSEEEVVETMAETVEQYMSKTRADYGSGIARPKIDDKDHFELKG
ncbi:hypothetical protein Tco_1220708 [Tanacetum coccineum]